MRILALLAVSALCGCSGLVTRSKRDLQVKSAYRLGYNKGIDAQWEQSQGDLNSMASDLVKCSELLRIRLAANKDACKALK